MRTTGCIAGARVHWGDSRMSSQYQEPTPTGVDEPLRGEAVEGAVHGQAGRSLTRQEAFAIQPGFGVKPHPGASGIFTRPSFTWSAGA